VVEESVLGARDPFATRVPCPSPISSRCGEAAWRSVFVYAEVAESYAEIAEIAEIVSRV
jgi:hypothetical protein